MATPLPSSATPSLLRREAPALLAVLLLAACSWWLIHAAAVARQRPFTALGEPPLLPLDGVPGAPSQLGPYAWMWSEAAFHYRTALMFAVDDYQSPDLLHADTWQQHPEGVDAWREYALMMEPVYGTLYRLLAPPGLTFPSFLLILVPAVHVLMFLPLYALGRVLGAPRRFALAGLLVYATCTLGFSALLTSLLLKETFSLLLLAVFLVLHAAAWQRPTPARLAAAGLGLAVLLASWHLAQFLVLVVLAASAVAATAGPRQPRPWLLPAVYAAAGLAAGLTPALAARGFVFSLPMIPVWAWLASAPVRRPRFRLGLLAVLAVGGAAAVLLNRSHAADYGHVSGLLLERLAHGFRKPEDPTALPFVVRLFWAAPFTSPTLSVVWIKTGLNLLPITAAAGWALWAGLRRGTVPLVRAMALTGLGFACAWLLSERLGVAFLLLVPALVAVAVGTITRPAAARWVLVLLLVIPAANLALNLKGVLRTAAAAAAGAEPVLGGLDTAEDRSRAGLFAWISANTPGPGSDQTGAPAVFVANIALSPQILLYAGRPVILNSQFENTVIRDRYSHWLEALFSTDERDLMTFVARYRADYVVIGRDQATASGRSSAWYLSGRGGRPVLAANALRMHFAPGTMRGLLPVYDNEHYRVFKVRVSRNEPPVAWDRGHGTWWQPGNWTMADGHLADTAADRARLLAAAARLDQLRGQLEHLAAGAEAAGSTPLLELQRRAAEPDVLAVFGGVVPGVAEALDLEITARLAATDPVSGVTLAAGLAAVLDGDQGLIALADGLVLHPQDSLLAGQVALLAGRRAEAAALFARSADLLGPADARSAGLWRDAAWWLLAAGRTDAAAEFAAARVDRIRSASPEAEFLARVAALGPQGSHY